MLLQDLITKMNKKNACATRNCQDSYQDNMLVKLGRASFNFPITPHYIYKYSKIQIFRGIPVLKASHICTLCHKINIFIKIQTYFQGRQLAHISSWLLCIPLFPSPILKWLKSHLQTLPLFLRSITTLEVFSKEKCPLLPQRKISRMNKPSMGEMPLLLWRMQLSLNYWVNL